MNNFFAGMLLVRIIFSKSPCTILLYFLHIMHDYANEIALLVSLALTAHTCYNSTCNHVKCP